LNAAELEEKTRHRLRGDEIKAVLKRRDKIVALYETLIAEKGENKVLYD
jgi:hypothetical protein